jgi:hypothetical protein
VQTEDAPTPGRAGEMPKLAKHLRRELRGQVHRLYEKVMLLRLLDPSFEEELSNLGVLEAIDRLGQTMASQNAHQQAKGR